MKPGKAIGWAVTIMLVLSVMTACGGQNAETASAESTGTQSAPATSELTGAADGAVYYVATDGSDSNPGTLEQPWRTIQKAADTAAAGDTVYVRGGTYNEKVVFPVSGQEGAPITFSSYKDEVPVLDGEGIEVSGDDTENALLAIADKSYIRIQGFSVTNYVSDTACVPAGIRVMGAGTGIEILNCRVYGIRTTYTDEEDMDRNAHGIAVYGTNGDAPLDGVVIDGCEVYDNTLGWSESVVLNGNVTNFRVTNNRIHDNDNIGIDFIGFEDTASANDQARDGVCSGNEVWNISSASNKAYAGDICADGIYVDGGRNIIIEQNRVWNCDIGIEAASEHGGRTTEYITIRNNVIYGCKAVAGIAFGGYDEERGSAEHILIYNNTMYDNTPNILIQYYCQSDTNVIRNNIFWKGVDFEGDTSNIVISNNLTEDPLFADEAAADFHLTEGSPALDAGAADENCGGLDIEGKPRLAGGTVDCGAYERQ